MRFFFNKNKSSIFAEKNNTSVDSETIQKITKEAFYRSAKENCVFGLVKRGERDLAHRYKVELDEKWSINNLYDAVFSKTMCDGCFNGERQIINTVNQYVNGMLANFLSTYDLGDRKMRSIGELAHIITCAALLGKKPQEDRPTLESFAEWLFMEHHKGCRVNERIFAEWMEHNMPKIEKMYKELNRQR